MRSHRTFLHLAQELAQSGFHVLRFDYFGSGDSEGCFDEGTLQRWSDDVVTAIDELRTGSGAQDMCLCGLRLGASIAATVDAELHGIDGLILWDPIVQGTVYLEELRSSQRNWLRGSFVGSASQTVTYEEFHGYPMTDSLVSSIQEMDLFEFKVRLTKPVVVFDTQGLGTLAAFASHLQNLGIDTHHRQVLAPPAWVKQHDDLESAMVPRAVISTLVQCAKHHFCAKE